MFLFHLKKPSTFNLSLHLWISTLRQPIEIFIFFQKCLVFSTDKILLDTRESIVSNNKFPKLWRIIRRRLFRSFRALVSRRNSGAVISHEAFSRESRGPLSAVSFSLQRRRWELLIKACTRSNGHRGCPRSSLQTGSLRLNVLAVSWTRSPNAFSQSSLAKLRHQFPFGARLAKRRVESTKIKRVYVKIKGTEGVSTFCLSRRAQSGFAFDNSSDFIKPRNALLVLSSRDSSIPRNKMYEGRNVRVEKLPVIWCDSERMKSRRMRKKQ